MLRISKKERQQLYNMNASIRRKIKRLKNTFNIDTHFEIETPSSFLTRGEVNHYKQEVRNFLKNEHQYVKLGLNYSNDYYFYVTKQEYKEFRKDVERQQRYAREVAKKAAETPLRQGGKKTASSSLGHILQIRPTIIRQGLRSPYQQMFPLNIKKANIRSRAQFNELKHAVQTYHNRGHYNRVNILARDNFMSALYNTFGNNAIPLINLLENMSGKEFQNFYESDIFADFDYIYSEADASRILKNISNALEAWLEDNNKKIVDRIKTSNELIDYITNFDELKQIQNMSSTKIIEDWTPHTMTFTYEDVTYRGVFRARELEQIKRGNITNSILEKARVIKRYNK